ncbi:unnamed protein product [Linum tenue]|uniref:Non-specific phospholipase C2 n=1 Tax=Linum tenue TaxID=586396 RepID=A0AAV0Q9F1_9ROSI|nr:unnamed protein product [Linum tenue]
MPRRETPTSTAAPFLLLLHLLLLSPPTNVHAVQPPTTSPIKTVVVLVMENRSFDHMLGWMKKLNPEINGADGSQWNPLNTSDPESSRLYFRDQAHYVDPDPGHSFQAIREQIFGSNDSSNKDPPPMNGFAQQALSMDPSANMSRDVMNGFHPDSVAVYKALVSEFAVFDRWFASVPASTQPNRLYVHSGTSHGATSNIPALLVKGYPQRTIFENIDGAGLSWGIYYQNIPATLFYRNLRKLKYVSRFRPYDLEFKSHARQGKLPNYTVVEQRYTDLKTAPANDDHPSHDVYHGQMFVKEPTPTSEYEHSSIPATVKNIFNLPSFLTKRDQWAGTFESIVQSRAQPRTDCPLQTEANEEAKLTEFQQEMLQLAAVLKGDNVLSSYPSEIGKQMTVKEGTAYMEDAVRRFFQAGVYAKKMGVDEEQIVQMKPSLTTRRSSKPAYEHP